MLSDCCYAKLKIEGQVTHYYTCTKCGDPCDAVEGEHDITNCACGEKYDAVEHDYCPGCGEEKEH